MRVIRWNGNRLARITLAATLAAAFTATAASAQSDEGNWGAEGRIGGGQSAYLLRWLNPNWSLVLGGGVTSSSSENQVNATNDVRSASAQVLIRREWGGGRVHPFFGFGPTLSYSHAVSKSPGGGAAGEATSDNIGFGGRFEFGAFGHVSQSVDLGIVLGATGGRNEITSKSPASTTEVTSNSTSFSLGNPQFVMRVRF